MPDRSCWIFVLLCQEHMDRGGSKQGDCQLAFGLKLQDPKNYGVDMDLQLIAN